MIPALTLPFLLAFVSLSSALPAPAPPGITQAPVVKRQGTNQAGIVVHLDGIGQVFSATGEVSHGQTVVAGQTRPVFQVGGIFAPYNVSAGDISAVNVLGGSLGLTYTTINGVVLPDLTYYAFQDQTEHITIPGILTFSDGSGPGSVTVPQVIFSGDLYNGFSGAVGNGAISIDLLGQTIVLTNTNGFAGNPTSGLQAGFSDAIIIDGFTIGASLAGALGTGNIAGTALGGLGPIATGGIAGSINGSPGVSAGGTIGSILGVEFTAGLAGVCGELSLLGIPIGNCPQATPVAANVAGVAAVTPTGSPVVKISGAAPATASSLLTGVVPRATPSRQG